MIEANRNIKSSAIERIYSRHPILILFIIGMLFISYVHYREITNPYFIYRDIGKLYFIYALGDAHVLSNDLACQAVRDPIVYQSSIPVAKPIIPLTIFLTKMFSLARALTIESMIYQIIALFFVFAIGNALSGKRMAFSLGILFLIYSATMDSFFGGAIRGAGFLLTCILYYCLVLKYNFLCVLLMPLAFLFYPPILPMITIASFLAVIYELIKNKKNIYMFLIFCITLLTLIMLNFYINHEFMVQLNQCLRWKSVTSVSPIKSKILDFLLNFVLNVPEHQPMYTYFTYSLLLFNVLFLFRRPRKILFEQGEKIFIAAAILAFIPLSFLHKGVASRQLIFSLPLVLLVYFWKQIIVTFEKKLHAMLFILLIPALIFISFNKYAVKLADFTKEKKTFLFISKLPQDTLIAGHPAALDVVPFFTKKEVFFNLGWCYLFSLPKKYEDVILYKKKEILKVIYATNSEDILNFIKANRITHFLITEYHYSDAYLRGDVSWYNKEFRDEAVATIKNNRNPNKDFILLVMAHRYGRDFGNGTFILDAQEILNHYKE